MSWNCEITTHGESSLWYEWIATKGLQFTGSVLIRTPRLLGACQCSHLSSPCSYLVLSLTYIIIIIVCTIVLQQHYYYCKYDVECETNRQYVWSLSALRRRIAMVEAMLQPRSWSERSSAGWPAASNWRVSTQSSWVRAWAASRGPLYSAAIGVKLVPLSHVYLTTRSG